MPSLQMQALTYHEGAAAGVRGFPAGERALMAETLEQVLCAVGVPAKGVRG